jgi:lambda family phage portal protein
MNLLDRVIGYVAPSIGRRRAANRMAMEYLSGQRSYDGATRGRRGANWRAPDTSANAALLPQVQLLRDRSRDLVRNDSYAERGKEMWVDNAVGSGITPTPETGGDKLDRQIAEAWEEFVETCDAEAGGDFYALQALACGTIMESGDVLTRRRRRRAADGLAIPLQLQLMEPDHLDTVKQTNGGNRVVAGIELDALNRRQAYHLLPDHPGETMPFLRGLRTQSVRIPADQVVHVYRKTRPGQLLGVPWLASVMLDLRDLGDYDQAELVRKKIEACLSVFVTTQDGEDPRLLGAETTDDDGYRIETLEPGMIEYLQPGEDVKTATPQPSAGYEGFVRQRLHKIAIGLRMPYILLTGDVSQVNFASYKAGLIQFQATVRRFQRHTLVPCWCQPVWRWFIESAYAAGRISEPVTRVRWTFPAFETVDRQKEALADLIEVRMGKTTMQEIIRRASGDPDRVLADMEKWAKEIDDRELILDSDPRKVTRAGVSQTADPRLLDGEAPETDTPPAN